MKKGQGISLNVLTIAAIVLIVLVVLWAIFTGRFLPHLYSINETTEIENLWTEGEYDYCVEWDGWIHLENLFNNCYDYKKNQPRCEYTTDDENQLIVHIFEDKDNFVSEDTKVYHCSRYVQSIKLIEED